jgi:hypothetical protein
MKLFQTLSLVCAVSLLSGCSTSTAPEPKYDELELLVFQMCMEDALASDRISRNQFDYDSPSESKEDTQFAYQICKDFFPEKK